MLHKSSSKGGVEQKAGGIGKVLWIIHHQRDAPHRWISERRTRKLCGILRFFNKTESFVKVYVWSACAGAGEDKNLYDAVLNKHTRDVVRDGMRAKGERRFQPEIKFTREIKFFDKRESISSRVRMPRPEVRENVNFKNLIRRNVAHLRLFVIQLARNIRPLHLCWMLLHVHYTWNWNASHPLYKSSPCHNKLPAMYRESCAGEREEIFRR